MSIFWAVAGWARVRRALRRASTATPVLTPSIAHVYQATVGTGRDWKASPAVKPMPDDVESAATNARIDREALWERLEMWADCLQRKRQARFAITTENLVRGGHLTMHEVEGLADTGWLMAAIDYFACELEQGYAKRQNVTGREKLMPRLTVDEQQDAREASRLASDVQAIERRRLFRAETGEDYVDEDGKATDLMTFEPTAEQERQLEELIVKTLGGEERILAECHGNPVLVEQVKAKARTMFSGRRHGE